ncbi:MAG: hypothetical protein CBD16_07365 [Betaproteobacteria bacterium TMED156]|nr:MAG: hypothetical protein CBD16_07365 [Betaproteobacteria bacterium TMED156]
MKLTQISITENVNTHLTHLEDLSLFKGKKGAVEAIRFLKNLSTIVKGHSPKKFNVTTKWDGSPAIVCGKDPADGKFFIGTKGVFAKKPKLNKSPKDIEDNHADVGENDKSALRGKLNTALQHLSKLNIQNVLQGDLMFTQGDLKERGFENKKYLTFKPNTITYAVPSDSELASKMRSAKVGIVFHTAYEGESLDKMSASFKVDISDLNQTPDVWFDDAYIKDFSGMATMTAQESEAVENAIADAQKHLNSSGNAFEFLDGSDAGNDLKINIAANMNANIKQNSIQQDPEQFFNQFIADYTRRAEEKIAQLKTGREGPAGQRRLNALQIGLNYLNTNKSNMMNFYALWLKLGAIKDVLYKKLSNIKAIDSFEEVDGELKVRDPEGFVAVDHIGSAVKVVDRLDFSRKNFMKSETIELDFVNDLMTEARMFRSRHGLSDYSAREMADNAFAHMIALQVMNREFKYSSVASTYAGRTASYGNFDYFRSNGTDLYAMIHSLFGKGSIIKFNDEKNSEILLKRMRPNMQQIKGFLLHISSSSANADKEKRMLMQLQSMLFVNDSRLRSMKRLAGDYENLTTREKRTLISSLLTYFRANSPKSSLTSYIRKLASERDFVDGDKVKTSKAMAAGAALAGAYIGYKLGRGKGPSYADKMKDFSLSGRKKK